MLVGNSIRELRSVVFPGLPFSLMQANVLRRAQRLGVCVRASAAPPLRRGRFCTSSPTVLAAFGRVSSSVCRFPHGPSITWKRSGRHDAVDLVVDAEHNAVQRHMVHQRRNEYLADKHCVRCKSTKKLEIHHINQAEKDTHRIWSWSEDRRKAELAKCQVLCSACHKIATAKQSAVETHAVVTSAQMVVDAYQRIRSGEAFACHTAACRPPSSGGTGGSVAEGPGSSAVRHDLAAPNGGFTITPKGRKIHEGISVALSGTETFVKSREAFDADGEVTPKLMTAYAVHMGGLRDRPSTPVPGTKPAIGAWHNPDDGLIEFNRTVVFPERSLKKALSFASAHDQISVMNLRTGEFIDTGGSGGNRPAD